MTAHHDSLLVRDFFVRPSSVVTPSEFVESAVPASPELVRFRVWPLFHPQ